MACPGSFASDVRVRFLERLAEVSGMSRFFLCNSGTEAVEAAIKLACWATGRPKLVAAMREYTAASTACKTSALRKTLVRPKATAF